MGNKGKGKPKGKYKQRKRDKRHDRQLRYNRKQQECNGGNTFDDGTKAPKCVRREYGSGES